MAASAVLAGGLSPLLPVASAAEGAQETVVPATLRGSYLTGSLVGATNALDGTEGAGDQGFFHRIEGRSGIVWTRYADGQTVAAPAAAGAWSMDGTGSDVLRYHYSDGRNVLFDAVSGTTRTLRMTEGRTLLRFYGSTAVTYRGVTGEDGTTTAQDFRLSTAGADGVMVDTEISGLPAGMKLSSPRGADATSIFFLAWLNGSFHMLEVDRATAQVRGWTQPLPSGISRVRFSRDRVALYGQASNPKVLVLPRSDLSATPTEVVLSDGTGPADGLALVGDWLVHRPSDGEAVKAVPIQGGPSVTLLASSRQGVAAVDGSAVFIGRTTVDDWGFQRLTPGADGGPPVVTQVKSLAKPAYKIQGLALEQGRLVVADNSRGERDTYVRAVAATGTPEFGARSSYDGTDMALYDCPPQEGGCRIYGTADDRAVWLMKDSETYDRLRVNGPGEYDYREHYVAAGGRITDVSGRYLIHETATQQTVLWMDDYGAREVVRTPRAAALSGDILWSAGTAPGTVTAYNLSTAKTTETLTTDAGCTPTELQALGRYLYWTCDGRAGVYDRTTKKSVAVPVDEAKLGDGYVVTHDKQAGKLTLTTVADGVPSSRVIGDLSDTGVSQRDVRWTVDESGANAAYVDDEEQVHLVPSGVAQQPLRLLAPAVKPSMITASEVDGTPATLATLLLSKPAAHWSLTVRSKATGKVVHTREGGLVRGALEVGWFGTDAGGKFLTDGPYDWSLTVMPADGVGSPLSLTGTTTLLDALPARHHHVGGSDAIGDLLTLGSTGELAFHQGTGKGTFTGYIPSTGWASSVKPLPFGDLSGDRCNDILMRLASGALRLYKPGCSGEFKPSTPFTTLASSGWNQYDVVTWPGDVTNDGRPDLIARNASTGTVYLYKGTSTGKFSARVKLWDNWKTYKKIVGAGDLNGDGVGDLLAQDKANNLYRYDGRGEGTFKARVKLGSNWGSSYNVVVGVGDITGDGKADIVSRDTGGNVWRNTGTGKGTFAARVKIATGWQGYKGVF